MSISGFVRTCLRKEAEARENGDTLVTDVCTRTHLMPDFAQHSNTGYNNLGVPKIHEYTDQLN